jgi:GT2 family glycosyltransferase
MSETNANSFRPPSRDERVLIVVFSKDRPLQLDATLSSLKLHCDDLHRARIAVLYTTSNAFFAAQYRILGQDHPDVSWIKERRFKPDLLDLVGTSSHSLFLVDDTLIVGAIELGLSADALARHPQLIGFSFRLGRNTRYCYTQDREQALPDFSSLGDGVLSFDWTTAELDFGYPLEVASSMYRSNDLLPLLREVEYRNPNTLEAGLAAKAETFRQTRPHLACYEQSVAASVPANLVQTAWENRIGGEEDLSALALANAYATGRRLDVRAYAETVFRSCHQELPFHYRQDPTVPTVSVVIPCFGQADYLPDAVGSVVAQTFTDWEIVVVDDSSPDSTAEVADRLAAEHHDRRIRVLRIEHGGVARARNAGIACSRGRYILPLDADDMIAPTMLERAVELLESEPDPAIAYTDLKQFGDCEGVILASVFDPFLLPAENQLSYCALFRREVWEAAGGYNPNMVQGHEDWDFWISCVAEGFTARRIPAPLFMYRVRAGGRYSEALEHDRELRRQLRANHPSLYRWPLPLMRAMKFKAVGAMRRIRRQGTNAPVCG